VEPDDGADALEGIDVGVSSWTSRADTLPASPGRELRQLRADQDAGVLDGYADGSPSSKRFAQ
jgi:hypothetical protein